MNFKNDDDDDLSINVRNRTKYRMKNLKKMKKKPLKTEY